MAANWSWLFDPCQGHPLIKHFNHRFATYSSKVPKSGGVPLLTGLRKQDRIIRFMALIFTRPIMPGRMAILLAIG